MDDRLEVQPLGGREREALLEIEAHLVPEHRQRAGTGAVVLFHAVGENPFHQVVVLAHMMTIGRSSQGNVPESGSALYRPPRPRGNVPDDSVNTFVS